MRTTLCVLITALGMCMSLLVGGCSRLHPSDDASRESVKPQVAAPKSPLPAVLLGETFEEAVRRFGPPRKDLGQKYVYRRATGKNEYEITVWWRADASASRLNPKLIVSEAHYVLDRDMPVAEVLKELPEVRSVCGNRCSAMALRDRVLNTWEVLVFDEKAREPSEKLSFRIRDRKPSLTSATDMFWLSRVPLATRMYSSEAQRLSME